MSEPQFTVTVERTETTENGETPGPVRPYNFSRFLDDLREILREIFICIGLLATGLAILIIAIRTSH